MRLFHGGVPGLSRGDLLQPGHSRDNRHPGCPVCEARAAGKDHPLDPATRHADRVYLTEDREYARYYASLYGRGDLYRVEPVGELVPSTEDKFRSYTCAAVRVVAVYARSVTLTMAERRRLYRRWAAFEGIEARDADYEFGQMISGMRR